MSSEALHQKLYESIIFALTTNEQIKHINVGISISSFILNQVRACNNRILSSIDETHLSTHVGAFQHILELLSKMDRNAHFDENTYLLILTDPIDIKSTPKLDILFEVVERIRSEFQGKRIVTITNGAPINVENSMDLLLQ